MNVYVREADKKDAYEMIPLLCNRDVEEASNLYGLNASDAIMRSVQGSLMVRAVVADKKLAAIYGLVPPSSLLSDVARPWVLTASSSFHNARAWVRLGRQAISGMLNVYPELENWADARHKTRLRWLAFMGFTVHPPEPYGVQGLMSCRFTIARSDGT